MMVFRMILIIQIYPIIMHQLYISSIDGKIWNPHISYSPNYDALRNYEKFANLPPDTCRYTYDCPSIPIVVGQIYKFREVLITMCDQIGYSYVSIYNGTSDIYIYASYSSNNGTTWDLAVGLYAPVLSIAYCDDVIVAIIRNGIVYSRDGIVWHKSYIDIYDYYTSTVHYSIEKKEFIVCSTAISWGIVFKL
jgi:hypothetical protein